MKKLVIVTIAYLSAVVMPPSYFAFNKDFEYVISHSEKYSSETKYQEMSKILDKAEKKAFPIKNKADTALFLIGANQRGQQI